MIGEKSILQSRFIQITPRALFARPPGATNVPPAPPNTPPPKNPAAPPARLPAVVHAATHVALGASPKGSVRFTGLPPT